MTTRFTAAFAVLIAAANAMAPSGAGASTGTVLIVANEDYASLRDARGAETALNALARKLGATVTVNAATDPDPAAAIKRQTDGGAQGVLVTAVGRKAFEQAIGMVARGGTVALNGLPPGDFPLDIFGMVLNGITVRGSIVGTRLDLQESLDFAGEGKVKATVHRAKLEDINDIFGQMHKGQIEGRMVLDMAG